MSEWLTLEELASYLKISKASLYNMVQKKEIPAVKLGRHWRFDREKIDIWMNQKEIPSQNTEFPWQDCLDVLLDQLKVKFSSRFHSLWIYGSWARGDAGPESDVDLLIVMTELRAGDFQKLSDLGYEATFGRGRAFVFSTNLVDEKTFLTGIEPLLLNVRKEGRRAA